MFVKARKSDVDTARLGVELAARKDELRSEFGIEDDAPEVARKRASANGAKRGAPAASK